MIISKKIKFLDLVKIIHTQDILAFWYLPEGRGIW
jgi:hypothetical protein